MINVFKYIASGQLRTKGKMLPLEVCPSARVATDRSALTVASCVLILLGSLILYLAAGWWRIPGWILLPLGTLFLLSAIFGRDNWKVVVSHEGETHTVENFLRRPDADELTKGLHSVVPQSFASVAAAPEPSAEPPAPPSAEVYYSTPATFASSQASSPPNFAKTPMPVQPQKASAMPETTPASSLDYEKLPYDPDPAYMATGKAVGTLRAKFYQAQHSWQGQLQIPVQLFDHVLVQLINELQRKLPSNVTFCRTLRPNSVAKKGLAALRLSIKRPGRFDAHCEVILRPNGPDILGVVSSYVFYRRSLGRKVIWALSPIATPLREAATMATGFLLTENLANALDNATNSLPRPTSDAGVAANDLAEIALRAIHAVRSRFVTVTSQQTTRFPDVI